MKKRIWGIILLLVGFLYTVPVVKEILRILEQAPIFGANGQRLNLIEQMCRSDMRLNVLAAMAGILVIMGAVVMILSPRRRKVRAVALEPAEVAPCEETADTTENPDAEKMRARVNAMRRREALLQLNVPAVTCVLHTRLIGTTFANKRGKKSRQKLMADMTEGEGVICRPAKRKRTEDLVGVFNTQGKQLGYLDTVFVRTLRETYPDHQYTMQVERIRGGNGEPYICDLQVSVFRS